MRSLLFSIFAGLSLVSCAFDESPRMNTGRKSRTASTGSDSDVRAVVDERMTAENVETKSLRVVLRLHLSEKGEVTKVEVRESNAPRSIQAMAMSWAKKSRWKPRKVDGVAVASQVILPIRFD